jgi:hypothetical protein
MTPTLESVLQHPGIWRGNQRAQTAAAALSTGYAALDELLPGGGWPRGALTELLIERQGIGELRLLTPALARLSQADGWLAWVAPPYVPYAAALAAAGIDLKRLVVAKPPSEADAWWTAEQALRSGACGALLAWLRAADERRMRRLQLAAETGHTWGVLFRHARAAQACRERARGACAQAARRTGEPAGDRGAAAGRHRPPGTANGARAVAGAGLIRISEASPASLSCCGSPSIFARCRWKFFPAARPYPNRWQSSRSRAAAPGSSPATTPLPRAACTWAWPRRRPRHWPTA